jgi:NAD(P)-dependent dehydrogenase (short-subunit alcohol dehydrogenase family)
MWLRIVGGFFAHPRLKGMTEILHSLHDRRILVIGASRGLGRGVALSLAAAGARVLAVGRGSAALAELRSESRTIDVRVGDATDPTFVANLLDDEPADGIVLVAGARPALHPIDRYSWEALCAPWMTDVKATFHCLQEALHRPWRDRGRVVVFSSGAALHGSPLSGGYAGAKQTQRFLCQYAAAEAKARGLPLTIQCVLPQLNPNTGLGAAGVRAYAARTGEDVEGYVRKRFGSTPLSPAIAGREITRLLADEALSSIPELLLTGSGLEALRQ